MPADRVEDRRRQRDQHDVAHLGRRVAEHAREDDDEREQVLRRAEHQRADRRRQQPRPLRDADAEQRDEHGAERHEAGEVRDEPLGDPAQALAGHQAADGEQPSPSRPGRGSPTCKARPPRRSRESTTTPSANSANSVTGCGSRLPSHSTVASRRARPRPLRALPGPAPRARGRRAVSAGRRPPTGPEAALRGAGGYRGWVRSGSGIHRGILAGSPEAGAGRFGAGRLAVAPGYGRRLSSDPGGSTALARARGVAST